MEFDDLRMVGALGLQTDGGPRTRLRRNERGELAPEIAIESVRGRDRLDDRAPGEVESHEGKPSVQEDAQRTGRTEPRWTRPPCLRATMSRTARGGDQLRPFPGHPLEQRQITRSVDRRPAAQTPPIAP